MLNSSSYQSLQRYLLPTDAKVDKASLGGLSGTLTLRRRVTVKPELQPVPTHELDQLVEVNLKKPSARPAERIVEQHTDRWFLDFKPKTAPASLQEELAKWIAVNALVGNLLSATLHYFAPKALPTVASALGGPVTAVLGVMAPIVLGVIKTAIVRCSETKEELIDERLTKEIRQRLAAEQQKLQKNARNKWIGAWLGNAIPDLTASILAAVGQQTLAEKLMAIIQPNLAPMVKAAVGYGIATKLATTPVKNIAIPIHKLKFE